MIKAMVTFSGDERDEHGMPKPFHNYFVVASPWQIEGSGVASIVPISTDSPSTARQHFIAEHGREDAAFNKAIDALKQLRENQGLGVFISRDD